MNALFKSFQGVVEGQIEDFISKISEEFDLDSERLTQVWEETLKENKPKLQKKGKKKGKKKSGKTNGYQLFCKEERVKIKEETPDMEFKDVSITLGTRWKALGDDQDEWREKASTQNASLEGGETPPPSPKKKVVKKVVKKKVEEVEEVEEEEIEDKDLDETDLMKKLKKFKVAELGEYIQEKGLELEEGKRHKKKDMIRKYMCMVAGVEYKEEEEKE